MLGVAAMSGLFSPEARSSDDDARDSLGSSRHELPGAADELCDLTAVDLAARIRRRQLSAREVEVLQLVADGQSYKEIGEALSLSALTVKSHLSRIGRKLGTGDRAQMVALAMRAGVIR